MPPRTQRGIDQRDGMAPRGKLGRRGKAQDARAEDGDGRAHSRHHWWKWWTGP